VTAGNALSNGIGIIFMRSFNRLLRTGSIRVGIIPIRVVVVWALASTALRTTPRMRHLTLVSKSRVRVKASFGCFATANDEEHAIGLHRKNQRHR